MGLGVPLGCLVDQLGHQLLIYPATLDGHCLSQFAPTSIVLCPISHTTYDISLIQVTTAFFKSQNIAVLAVTFKIGEILKRLLPVLCTRKWTMARKKGIAAIASPKLEQQLMRVQLQSRLQVPKNTEKLQLQNKHVKYTKAYPKGIELTSSKTTHFARCLVGRNSAYNVTLCGTHPMAKPTKPRSNNSHAKLGASELRNP